MTKVTLSDLSKESNMSLLATMNDKQTEVPITLAELTEEEMAELSLMSGHCLPLEVITMENEEKEATVNFANSKATLALIALHNKVLYKWGGAKIHVMTLQSGKKIHLLKVASVNGEKYNRRRGVRVNIDKLMEVKQGDNHFSVVVRDLSYCGVKITERGESKVNPNQPFMLYLVETSRGKEVTIGKVACKVVRQNIREDGVTESGCIIAKDHYTFLQKYVATKQLESLRGKEDYRGVQKAINSESWKYKIASQLSDEKGE